MKVQTIESPCINGGIDVGNIMAGIHVISRESYIKARIIKIKTTEPFYIEQAIMLANNGISSMLSSHSQTPDGYQMFLYADADGGFICQRILDTLLSLPDGNVVIEKINC